MWDTDVAERGLGTDVRLIAGELLDEVTDEGRATWQTSTPIDWANESFVISVSLGFRHCALPTPERWYHADNERLDEGELERTVVVERSYIETHTLTVRDRLVKAGVRLGGLLNKALEGVAVKPDSSFPSSKCFLERAALRLYRVSPGAAAVFVLRAVEAERERLTEALSIVPDDVRRNRFARALDRRSAWHLASAASQWSTARPSGRPSASHIA